MGIRILDFLVAEALAKAADFRLRGDFNLSLNSP
jgi:hypothetical protein